MFSTVVLYGRESVEAKLSNSMVLKAAGGPYGLFPKDGD